MLEVVMAPVSGACMGQSTKEVSCSHSCVRGLERPTLSPSFACPFSDSSRSSKTHREKISHRRSFKPRWLREGSESGLVREHRRKCLHVAQGSGRFSASVIRGITGKQRIRRPQTGADGSEEDESGDDEPYSSCEDAPIFGSLHGDSFDVDGNKDDSAESVQTLNSQSHALFGSPSSGEGSELNGVLKRNGTATTENGKLEAQDQLMVSKKSKKKKEERSLQGLASGTSRKSTKKGKKDVAQLMLTGSGVKDKSTKKAERKLKRSKAFNGRAEKMVDSKLQDGALSLDVMTQLQGTEHDESNGLRSGAEEATVLVTGGSQNGAQTRSERDSRRQSEAPSADTSSQLQGTDESKGYKFGAEEENGRSQNGAQICSAEEEVQSKSDGEEERLEERLTSSLQAGPSNSEEQTSGRDALHSLHFSLNAGSGRSAFIVSAAAIESVAALAIQEEASENGLLTGAAILEAASSLVENLVHPTQVIQAGEEVSEQMAETVDAASDTVSNLVETVTDSVASSVAETVDTVAESLSDVGDAVVSFITEEEELGDTEFETFSSRLTGPEFRGRRGLDNYRVLHDGKSSFHLLYDAYNFSLKLPPHQFALVVLALPLLMSVAFTGIYLLDMQGLVPEESVQAVLVELQKEGHVWGARAYGLFQVFMFSLSLATGLQPVLAPVTPFSFIAANMNAPLAQLLFVFLSGSVFARLSQRSRPIRCSTVALICPPCHTNRVGKEWTNRVLMARYVLAGPKPSELVDVKVDLTFTYNTITRSGSYFMRQVSLKLVKSEVAHQVGGMLVRHVIDESSPLYRRTEEMLRKEDAVFKLSVVGLERSSMQSVFELQHYCVADGDVIWDAEFEDTVYVNKSLQRVIDHSKLSRWKAVSTIGLPTVNA